MSPEELSVTDRLRGKGVPIGNWGAIIGIFTWEGIFEYVTQSLARVGGSISRRMSAVKRLEAKRQSRMSSASAQGEPWCIVLECGL